VYRTELNNLLITHLKVYHTPKAKLADSQQWCVVPVVDRLLGVSQSYQQRYQQHNQQSNLFIIINKITENIKIYLLLGVDKQLTSKQAHMD